MDFVQWYEMSVSSIAVEINTDKLEFVQATWMMSWVTG